MDIIWQKLALLYVLEESFGQRLSNQDCAHRRTHTIFKTKLEWTKL